MKQTLKNSFGIHGLGRKEAKDALHALVSEESGDEHVGAFLAVIASRGITQTEFEGFFDALSETARRIDLGCDTVDVCGTGGDCKDTFNISTAAAFVLAGSGIHVAKHGNASASSGCGSSDVLASLGVKFTNDESELRAQLAETRFTYLHAPLFQPSLKRLGRIRSSLGFRTFFNMLGPLLNPARPRYRFAGVSGPSILRHYRYFLESTDTCYSVVHSRDGYDEISLTAPFDVVTDQGIETLAPEDIGFTRVDKSALSGELDASSNAALLARILKGGGTDAQNAVVIANAAFARKTVTGESVADCVEVCRESLMSGKAASALTNLIEITNS